MSEKSNIEWTDATWNPVRGCTKVSPGCAHCYAETFAERFRGVKGHPYEQGFDLRLVPEKLGEPLKWKKPRRVFVNSMSDLFQDGVPNEYIDRVFAMMALSPQHTFQVLTKRADRMHEYMNADDVEKRIAQQLPTFGTDREGWLVLPLTNVWLGVSVENQHWADERISALMDTPAVCRFISAEPLLGPLELTDAAVTGWLGGYLAYLDWVIVGGESGPHARPFDVVWARSILRQCRAASVPVFMKQLGARPEIAQGCGDCDPCLAGQRCYQSFNVGMGLKSKKGGDITEWPADLRVREFPGVGSEATRPA